MGRGQGEVAADELFYGEEVQSSVPEKTPEEVADQKSWKSVEHIFECWYCEGESGAGVHPRGVGIYDDLALPIHYLNERNDGERMEVQIASGPDKKPLLSLVSVSDREEVSRIIYSGQSVSELVSVGKRQALEWGNADCFNASAQNIRDSIEALVKQIEDWK